MLLVIGATLIISGLLYLVVMGKSHTVVRPLQTTSGGRSGVDNVKQTMLLVPMAVVLIGLLVVATQLFA